MYVESVKKGGKPCNSKELTKVRELKAYYKQEIEFVQTEKINRLSQMLGIDKKKFEKIDFSDNEEAKILANSFDEQIQELLIEQQQEIEKVRRGFGWFIDPIRVEGVIAEDGKGL